MATPRPGSDGQPPTAGSNLSVAERTTDSITVSWDAASDAGGSGLDRYAVTVDGRVETTVDPAATSATVAGLSADTSYAVGLTAFDAADNESHTVVVTATTADASSDGSGSGSGGSSGAGSDGGDWWGTGGSGDDSGGSGDGSDTGGSGGWWGSGGSGSGSDSNSGSGWW